MMPRKPNDPLITAICHRGVAGIYRRRADFTWPIVRSRAALASGLRQTSSSSLGQVGIGTKIEDGSTGEQ